MTVSSDGKKLTFLIGGEEIGSISFRRIEVVSMEMGEASMLEVQLESPQRIYTLFFGGDFE